MGIFKTAPRATSSYALTANNTAPKWWHDKGLRTSMLHILTLYTCLYTLGYDGALFNGIQSIQSWQRFFGRPTGIRLGLIASSFYFPKVVVPLFAPSISDRYGRKVILWTSVFFNIAGAVVCGASNSLAMLVAGRVLAGIGTSCGNIGSITLVSELAHPRLRHQAAAFIWTMYFVGAIFASWIAFGLTYYSNKTSDTPWRILLYLQAVGPVALACGLWTLPQSPRWLLKQGREAEAHAILAQLHANGKMDDELVLLTMREMKAGNKLDEQAKSGSWSSFLSTSVMRRRFFTIVLLGVANQCSGNGIISYFLVPILRQIGIAKPPQTAGINGGLIVWSSLFNLGGAFFVDRFGRRPLFLTSFAGMFASFVFIMALSGTYANTRSASIGVAVIPFLFIFNAFYAIAQAPLAPVYVPEICPMAVRAKGIALLSLTQALAGLFNTLVNPVALAAISWKYYSVYVVLLGVYFVLFYFFVRETRGLTIEEAAMVYEPEETRQAAIEEERKARLLALGETQSDSKSDELKVEHEEIERRSVA